MKNLLLFVLLLGTIACYAQETKKIKHKISRSEKEVYYVLKSDGITKHGLYTHYVDDIKVELGNYANGKRTGKWQLTKPQRNEVSTGNYVDGKKSGVWNTFLDGFLLARGTYENDMKQGTWQCFSESFSHMASGSFKDDQKTGVWQFYTEENVLIQEFDFDTKQMVYTDSALSGVPIKSGPYKGLQFVDKAPCFTAGNEALFNFIRENLILTNEIKVKQLTGVTYANFTVLENGEVSDIKILKSAHEAFNPVVIEVIKKTSGKWTPATFEGKNVALDINLPVGFYEDLSHLFSPTKKN